MRVFLSFPIWEEDGEKVEEEERELEYDGRQREQLRFVRALACGRAVWVGFSKEQKVRREGFFVDFFVC